MAGLPQGPPSALSGEQWYIRGCQNSLESVLGMVIQTGQGDPDISCVKIYGRTMLVGGGSTVQAGIHTPPCTIP